MIAVHADTLTPAQAAALGQSLDALKAKVLQLQSQAAAQGSSPAAAGVPLSLKPPALSPEDVVSLQNALSLLASALSDLQSTFARNPQIAAGREAALAAAFQGIGKTLAAISVITGSGPAATVAAATPAPAVNAPSVAQAQPETPSITPLVSSADNGNPAPAAPAEIAQVSSAWSLKNMNWPLVAVVVLIIVAVALWLFWPGEEDERKKTAKKSVAPAPVRSAPLAPPATLISAKPASAPQSPLASVVSAPPQASQQQQQRKPA